MMTLGLSPRSRVALGKVEACALGQPQVFLSSSTVPRCHIFLQMHILVEGVIFTLGFRVLSLIGDGTACDKPSWVHVFPHKDGQSGLAFGKRRAPAFRILLQQDKNFTPTILHGLLAVVRREWLVGWVTEVGR